MEDEEANRVFAELEEAFLPEILKVYTKLISRIHNKVFKSFSFEVEKFIHMRDDMEIPIETINNSNIDLNNNIKKIRSEGFVNGMYIFDYKIETRMNYIPDRQGIQVRVTFCFYVDESALHSKGLAQAVMSHWGV